MNTEDKDIGKTVIYRNLTDEQYNSFIKLLSLENFEFIRILDTFTNGNKELVLKMLDVLAGESLKFPTRKKIIRVLEKVYIYYYLKSRDFSKEAYRAMAKDTGKTVLQIENMMKIVKRDLGD